MGYFDYLDIIGFITFQLLDCMYKEVSKRKLFVYRMIIAILNSTFSFSLLIVHMNICIEENLDGTSRWNSLK